LLGIGIASMHYVGIHGLAGHFVIEYDYGMVLLSVLIAIGAAYRGLRIYLAQPDGRPSASPFRACIIRQCTAYISAPCARWAWATP
jgi:NO-binding membrane sensor protein with MHYT domain